MGSTSDLDRVAMVVLRFMRRPIFALIIVYAVGITGMALIPGVDADGNPEYMSLFHAFYFFTYTATTTGFGEIPSAFTDEQRLWAIFCLYMGVIAWLYAIGSIIRLMQNPHFILAVNERKFARLVCQIKDPYYIVCGFGDTGSLLARGLSDHYLRAVVLDHDPERIKALALRDYRVKMLGLCADPSVPKHLVDAGVKRPNCKAVVALTNDEQINRQIAVVAKLLNPSVKVISRTTSERHVEHLKSLEDVVVINPFAIFAELLSTAILAPRLHNMNGWFVRAPDARLGHPLDVPSGAWLLCGYGRMGQSLHVQMAQHDIQSVVIDPDAEELAAPGRLVHRYADYDTLTEAGIEHAAGIVAGTDSDSDNLSIVMCAQQLNPRIFTIVRQNRHENQLAFDAARADLILQSSLTTARRILKTLISPLIQELIEYLHDQEQQTEEVVRRLQAAVGDQTPHLWRTKICRAEAATAMEFLRAGRHLTLGDLIRNPDDFDDVLSCVPLVLQRNAESRMLPTYSEQVLPGDRILFCGTERSASLLAATLNNPYTLHFVTTGTDSPRGFVFDWLARWTSRRREALTGPGA